MAFIISKDDCKIVLKALLTIGLSISRSTSLLKTINIAVCLYFTKGYIYIYWTSVCSNDRWRVCVKTDSSRLLRKTQVLDQTRDQTREQTRCFQRLQALYTQQDFRNRVNETKVQYNLFQSRAKENRVCYKLSKFGPIPFFARSKFPLSSWCRNGNLIFTSELYRSKKRLPMCS